MRIDRIETIINRPVTSNCFIAYHPIAKGHCIVIDPGSQDSSQIKGFIADKQVDYIFLTHEHFDHVWSTDSIRKSYKAKVVASPIVSEYITDARKNMSFYYNQMGFELQKADIEFTDCQTLDWHGTEIRIIATPGHTSGSICILVENIIFTGDTIISGTPTVTKLPTGSADDLEISLKKIDQLCIRNSTVLYPGHGEKIIY